MQNTTHYNLKKPDYTDFADIQDINDNMDTIDEELAAPTGDARDQVVSFADADLDTGITSFPTFLTKIVSGMKLAKFLRDFKAGMAYVLHVGDLINNATCTESGKALDARMGKTLQDQITSLNDSLGDAVFTDPPAVKRVKQLSYDLSNGGLGVLANTDNIWHYIPFPEFYSSTLLTATLTFVILGSVIIIKLNGSSTVTLTTGAWTTFATAPTGLPKFSTCTLALVNEHLLTIRNNNGALQYNCQISRAFWPQGSGCTLKN